MIITSKDNTVCDSFTEPVKNMLVYQAGRYNFCLHLFREIHSFKLSYLCLGIGRLTIGESFSKK